MVTGIKKKIKEFFKHPHLESFLARLSAGCSPDHFLARLPPYCTSYSANTLRKVQRHGINYELDLSDYMEWVIFYDLKIEPREKLYSLIKPGNLVIDIGANIGEVTMNFARKVGKTGHVYSFEPNPITFDKLRRHFSINAFKNITLSCIGLSEVSEEVRLATEVENNRGGARVMEGIGSSDQIVKLLPLDLYVKEFNIPIINLIKIDVEGYELKVLKGAEQTLKSFKPILFIELDENNLRDQGASANALINFLRQSGYDNIFHAETDKPIDSYMDFSDCHYDIIAR